MIALLLPLIFIRFNIANASGTEVSIDYYGTPYVFDTTLVPGTQFTINMTLDYVEPNLLWAYQLALSFNPEVLHGVSVENGPFLGSQGGKVFIVPGHGFDNEAGRLRLCGACLWPNKNHPRGGSDEFGALCSITFEVVGYGGSHITMGAGFPVGKTGLLNKTGGWIIHKADDPDSFFDGYFDNRPGPQLWIREKHGTFGGGAYPEWHVNLAGEEQILYSKVANSGDMAAWVKVKFTVDWVEGALTAEYWSNEAEVPAVYIDPDTGDKVFPLVIVETDPFVPGPEGKYTITACLYFKAGGLTEYAPYELVEAGFGGDGAARDPANKFKVQEEVK